MTMFLIAFVIFIVFLFLGVPIAFSMGLSSIIGILATGNSLAVVGQRLFSGINSFSLMAIPFFMLSGELMTAGGISKRLVNFASALVGRFTGGLGMVDILTSVIFAGVSGSAAADTAAIGSIMIEPMKKKGYTKGLACVIQATAGSLGPIIPPSMTMIIYCSITNQSIGELFMAGVIPGLIIAGATALVTFLYAKKLGIKGEKGATGAEVWKATKDAILALIMPIIIIGGIVSGLFTATEAGAIAVFYALVISLFVYKELSFRDLPKVFLGAAASSTMALLIVASANVFSWIVAYAKVPTIIVNALVSITDSKYVIMILLEIGVLFSINIYVLRETSFLRSCKGAWKLGKGRYLNTVLCMLLLSLTVALGILVIAKALAGKGTAAYAAAHIMKALIVPSVNNAGMTELFYQYFEENRSLAGIMPPVFRTEEFSRGKRRLLSDALY